MKPPFAAFLIVSILVSAAHADCAYFRVAAKPVDCKSVDPKTVKANDPYPEAAPSDVPELDEPEHQAFIQVHCSCDYSLMGSDPRCDVDQTLERSTVVGVQDAADSCRRAVSICRDTCPPRLP